MSRGTNLSIAIYKLLDKLKFSDAKDILVVEVKKIEAARNKDFIYMMDLCGCLIDVGSESLDEELLYIASNILNQYEVELKKVTELGYYYYYVGNIKHALYLIYCFKNKSTKPPTIGTASDYLFDSKNSYFKAYKLIDLKRLKAKELSILTNLANELIMVGRYVEAIQLYDIVLIKKPNHPQANLSKASALWHLDKTTAFKRSQSLYANIYFHVLQGEQFYSKHLAEIYNVHLFKQQVVTMLDYIGFSYDNIAEEKLLNYKEFKSHPPQLRFFLTNFLILNEHSLYCNCNCSSADDLSIGLEGFSTSNRKLLKLEILISRLKSEFSFARNLFYDYSKNKKAFEITVFQDLQDGSINGSRIELLRNSFKSCFSILDKIGEGLFYLFDLPLVGKRENILFHTFWEKDKPNGERWKKLKEESNLFLTSLYSIASDLTKTGGEFDEYKDLRNKLEHKILTVTSENTDKYQLRVDGDIFSPSVSEQEFKEKTLHLLQMTRAAIFSFVFCCRNEFVLTNGEAKNQNKLNKWHI